jgi:hypothetical protein
MIGVVLWTDHREKEAVIWCEDHGELALYRKPQAALCGALQLDVGDLVTFDVETVRDLRIAHNPELLEEGYYPELTRELCQTPSHDAGARRVARPSADVIPLFRNISCGPTAPCRTAAQTG